MGIRPIYNAVGALFFILVPFLVFLPMGDQCSRLSLPAVDPLFLEHIINLIKGDGAQVRLF